MATPSQWDQQGDVTYADPNSFHNLYAKPTPKNKRNKIEPTYAEPRDSIKEPTYLNTHRLNNDPTYAYVQHYDPAYASVQNNDLTYASVQHNEPAYASVQHNDPTYASVQRNEPDYASVQPSEPTYASVQNHKPNHASEQKKEPTYANQMLAEYQNLKALNVADNKKTSQVGINSKESDPNSKEHKTQNQDLERQNSNNIKTANDADSKPSKMAGDNKTEPQNTYVNLLKELKGRNHGYINADVKNDVEPAYCEVIKSTK